MAKRNKGSSRQRRREYSVQSQINNSSARSRLVSESILPNTMHADFLDTFHSLTESMPIGSSAHDASTLTLGGGKYDTSAQHMARNRMKFRINNAAKSDAVPARANATAIRKNNNKIIAARSNAYKSATPKSDNEYLSKIEFDYEPNKSPRVPRDSSKIISDSAIDDVKKSIPPYNSGKKAATDIAKKTAKESDKLMSKLGKYGSIGLGLATTAWLVNKLSDTRGQQTNAQLYGQQRYY